MDFPILDLMNPDACHQFLLDMLHPAGLHGPTCRRSDALAIHDRHRPPVFDSRCRHCGSVFNGFTGTPLQKTHRTPVQLVRILRGICQGTPTAQLARERRCDRKHLLTLRHRLQHLAQQAAAVTGPVSGTATAADEMFQNAGEKRPPASRPQRPTPATSQQASRARNLRERSAPGGRRGQP